MTAKEIQAVLKKSRKDLGLSQQKAGDKSGILGRTIHNLEGGKDNVTLPLIVKYAESMGLEVIIKSKTK